jgi:hypothetical protein
VGTATAQRDDSWTRAEWLAVNSRLAKLTTSHRFMTLWRLYVYETLLQRLAQHFEHVAAELRQFVQKQDAVVRPRHLAWQGHLAAPDQADIGDGVMRGRDTGGPLPTPCGRP